MHISVSPIPYNAESRGAADGAGRHPPKESIQTRAAQIQSRGVGKMEQYILELKGITKIFPGVKALDRVSFQLKAGEIHALM